MIHSFIFRIASVSSIDLFYGEKHLRQLLRERASASTALIPAKYRPEQYTEQSEVNSGML